jgi:hypothetical protein
MKNISLLLLFITGFVNAQSVNIPDANFKAKLLASDISNFIAYGSTGYIKIDANNDGDIDFLEALAVTKLRISNASINDLTGIEEFTNLTYLDCNSNQLSTLNISVLTGLTYLKCSYNAITFIDFSTLTNLQTLDCTQNQLSQLNINSPSINQINISNNLFTSLNLSTFSSLTLLSCNFNVLTSIETPNTLVNLECSHNQLTDLDLTGYSQLTYLDCSSNQLSSLIVYGCYVLDFANVESNNFTTLDFSESSTRVLSCDNNPLLDYVNLKNGVLSQGTVTPSPPVLSFSNLPLLKFVCVDEVEAELVLLAGVNPTLVSISSYCTFVPGGNYNTITGTIQFDADNNGCDSNDSTHPYEKINILDGNNIPGSSFINSAGNYTFYTLGGNYLLTPEVQNPTYFTVSPPFSTINFPLLDNSTQTQNFCITANGVHPDLEIIIVPTTAARPGFDSEYKLIYKNKGNQTQTGTINLSFDDDRTDFVSSLPNVDNQSLNALLWNYSSIQPFETRVIDFTLNINSPVEIPAVNDGDILEFTSSINYALGDETPLDNVFELNQIVVNSFDPNDKTCLEGRFITPENVGKYVHYNINFENTGTADAINIVVKDVIDISKFDLSSIQLLYGSHPIETKLTGNSVEFIFKNINLPPSSIQPIGGHGNVLFKIKTLPTLLIGDVIANIANIYFDYNAPIETNEARSTIALLSNPSFIKDKSITVAPNPAKNKVVISAKSNLKSIEFFDVEGRLLQTVLEDKTTSTLDISNKAKGVYFLKIISEAGSSVEKLIKE